MTEKIALRQRKSVENAACRRMKTAENPGRGVLRVKIRIFDRFWMFRSALLEGKSGFEGRRRERFPEILQFVEPDGRKLYPAGFQKL